MSFRKIIRHHLSERDRLSDHVAWLLGSVSVFVIVVGNYFFAAFYEASGASTLFMHQDVEFLYRANRRGYKIGNIGMNCLVHDHKQIDSESGRRYEAIRFDEERLKKSRQYLKEKYGLGSRL